MNRQTSAGIAIVAQARRTAIALSASIGLGLIAPGALATPTGGEFITPQGGGGIYQFGDVTNVLLDSGVALNRHIIDWQGLNLAQNESMNFLGLEGYRVLNRVVGSGATQIDGILNASTGHVYVVNAAGVIFGQNAVINAASMHAAAASVTNEDFLSGDSLTFDVGPGAVEFHGTLNGAEHVSLIGSRVVNTADLSAGMIVMAVGDTVILKDLMNSRISVEIDGSDMNGDYTPEAGSQTATIESGDPAIHNSGSLQAGAGGGVTLATGDLLGLAIQHDGEIRAAGGDVDLVAQGGAVWTSMANPDVDAAGLIDVSATAGGGTINIIGSAVVHEGLARSVGHGGSVALRSFANTVLADAARIDTSGGGGFGVADAGTILLESINGTVYAGQPVALVANGGAWGGNGGDVTIQGGSLEFLPIVRQTASSAAYQNGALVIDASGRTRVIDSLAPLTPVDGANLSTAIVAEGAYGRVGASVGQTLSSVSGALTLASTEALRLQSSLSFDDAATLVSSDVQLAIDDVDQRVAAHTLTLVGSVSMENHATLEGNDSLRLAGGSISGDGVSSLVLHTSRLADLEGDLGEASAKLGSLSISVGSNLELNGDGNDLVQSVHVAGDLSIGGAGQGAGDPILASAVHDLSLRVDGNVSIGADGASAFSFNSGQGIGLQAGGSIDNRGDFFVDGNLSMRGTELESSGSLFGSSVVLEASAGDLTASGPLGATGGVRGADGSFGVALASAGDLTVTGQGVSVAPGSPGGFVSMTAGGDVTLSTTIDAPTAAVEMTSTGGDMTIQGVITSGAAALTAAGDITLDSAVTAVGDLDVSATGGHLAVGAAVSGGVVTLSGASAAIGHAVAATTDLSASATAGDLDVNAGLSGETMALHADSGVLTTRVGLESGELTMSAGAVRALETLKTTADRGAGDITLHAATGVLQLDQAVDAAGALSATADAGSIVAASTLSGSSVDLSAASGMSLADVLATSTVLIATTGSGDVGVAGVQAGGDVTASVIGGSWTGTSPLSGNAIDLVASGDMTLTDVTAGDVMTLTSGGTMTMDTGTATGSLVAQAGALSASDALSGSMVEVRTTGDMTLAAVTAPGTVTLHAGGQLELSDAGAGGDLVIDAGSLSASGLVQGDDVTIDSTADMVLSTVLADGEMMLASGDALRVDVATATGALTMDAGGDLTATGAVSGERLHLRGDDVVVAGVHAESVLRIESTALSASGTLSGGAVDVTSTQALVADVVTAVDDLTLSAGGDMTLGSVTAGDAMTLASGGTMAMESAAAAGDLTITSGDLSATGTLSGDGVDVTAAVMAVQDVTAEGDVQIDAGSLTAADVMSGAVVDLTASDAMTLGSVTAGDAMTLASGGTMAMESAAAAGDLTITSGDLSATGTLSGDSVDVTAVNDMGLVEVAADSHLQLTAASISVSDSLAGARVSVASGWLTLNGTDVQASDGSLTLDVDRMDVTAAATLSATEDLFFGADGSRTTLAGDLTMSSTGGELRLTSAVDGGGNLAVTAADELLVAGNIGAVDEVTSLSLVADRLVFADALAVITATGDVSLNDSDRASLQAGLPSIYGFGDTLAVSSRDGDVRIGSNQGLAYLGDLSLTAGDQLVVGDITALGDLTLSANQVLVQRRAGEAVLTPGGMKDSPQTSIVSGGDLLVTGDLSPVGDGLDPRLAGVDSTRGVPVQYAGDARPFTAADMELTAAGEPRLALIPLPSTPPSPVDPNLVAAESQPGEVEFDAAASDLNWRLLDTEVLAQLGIEIVEGQERPSGGRRFARAGMVENELTATLADPRGGLIQVVRARLDPRFVQRAVVAYADVISTGDQPGSLADAGTVLRAAESSWSEQASGEGEALAYRDWLSQGETPLQQDATRILSSLQATYDDLHRAGLTATEIDASRRFVAEQMSAGGSLLQVASAAETRRSGS